MSVSRRSTSSLFESKKTRTQKREAAVKEFPDEITRYEGEALELYRLEVS